MKDIYFVLEESGLRNFKILEAGKIRTHLLEKLEFAEKCKRDYFENMDNMNWFERLDVHSKCYMRLTESIETLKLFDEIGKNQFLNDMYKELSYLNQFHILHEIVDFDEINNL